MKLVRLQEDKNAPFLYDEFVRQKPECMLYHSTKYKTFIKQLLGCEEEYLVVLENNAVRGILPLMYTEKEGIRVYNSLPYYGSHGGIIADQPDARRMLSNEYKDIAMRESTLSCTMIENPLSGNQPSDIPWNYSDSRIGQITNIECDEEPWEQIMARLAPRARGSVRKALKEGVMVERDPSQLDRLWSMHQSNMERIGGQPKSKRFFELIPQYFAAESEFDIYLAKRNGMIVATLLVFYFNQTVEYFVPAVNQEFRNLQPMSLILMTAMVEASRRGYKYWNWGGTWHSQDSLYFFKKQWGARDYRYSYFTYLNDPSILQWTRHRILEAYPNYYVIPFGELREHIKNGTCHQ
jgi:hypothetical protein